jgi:hypothetical protein
VRRFFTTLCGGKTIQKMEFPRPILHKEATLTTTDINQSVNSAIHHTFISQSGALVNALQNFLNQTQEGTTLQQPNKGLQYFCALGYKRPNI